MYAARVMDPGDGLTIVDIGSLSQDARTQLEARIRSILQTAYQPFAVSPVEVDLMLVSNTYITRVNYTPNLLTGGSVDLAQTADITLDGRPLRIRLSGGQESQPWSMPPPSSMGSGASSRLGRSPLSMSPQLEGRLAALRGLPPQTPPLRGPPVESIFGPLDGRDLRSAFSFSGPNIRPSILRTPRMSSSILRSPAPTSTPSSSSDGVARRLDFSNIESDGEEEGKEMEDVAPPTLPRMNQLPALPGELEGVGMPVADDPYDGPVFDMSMASDTPIRDFIKDEDNVVFLIEGKAVGYPRSQLRSGYEDGSAIFYRCNIHGDTVYQILPENVVFTNPYYKLSTHIGSFFIPMPRMIRVLGTNHQVWRLTSDAAFPDVDYSTARTNIYSRRTVTVGGVPLQYNLDGQPIDLSSATHCGPGSNARVRTANPVRLSTAGGRRRHKTRRQKKRRSHPTRRRKVRHTRR